MNNDADAGANERFHDGNAEPLEAGPPLPFLRNQSLSQQYNKCANSILTEFAVPNYPSFRELTEEIQSPTAISLGLGEAGTPLRARCYNCGQMGHISYDCKQPQVRKACYTCGNQGHLSRDWYWQLIQFHVLKISKPAEKKSPCVLPLQASWTCHNRLPNTLQGAEWNRCIFLRTCHH